MAVSQRLELRHSQSLVMTPQLQQAIKLLQLSNLDLRTYVEQELERNPLLERSEQPEAATEAQRDEPRARGDEDDYDDRGGESDWDTAPDSLADWSAPPSGGASVGRGEEDISGLDQRLPGEISLREHLLEQARTAFEMPVELAVAEALIDSLDESGYLAGTVEELADLLGVETAVVEELRRRMLGFDPAGVFACSLAECLATQLRERNRLDPAMQALIDNLELLASRDYAKLRRLCGVDSEDFGEMLQELKALDPKPALGFGAGPVQPVIPDILMRPAPGGGFAVELNPDTLPRVLVNRRYYAEISAQARDRIEKQYLNEQLQSANWLTRALDQRATTILKVAGELVRRQHSFFTKGIEHLKPLTLRDIAEVIEMHESTVSRVTANKYIATPRGTYELKYFFTASLGGASGEGHSAEAVRHRIKALIDAETPKAVLSDDRIVEILRAEGIDIARRTVAKYREAMRIPSSPRRRREKAVQF
jgi:RNA polymerase sigma-54 factor